MSGGTPSDCSLRDNTAVAVPPFAGRSPISAMAAAASAAAEVCCAYAPSRSLAGGVRGFSTVAVASTGIRDSCRESVGRNWAGSERVGPGGTGSAWSYGDPSDPGGPVGRGSSASPVQGGGGGTGPRGNAPPLSPSDAARVGGGDGGLPRPGGPCRPRPNTDGAPGPNADGAPGPNA